MSDAEIIALPPALQLQARGRLAIGDVPVLTNSPGKVRDRIVALDVQAANRHELCLWQARFYLTHCFASDAAWKTRLGENGIPVSNEDGVIHDTSVGVGFHDGVTLSGLLEEAEGSNNYLGELGALVVALQALPDGARVLGVVDATSPVHAWLRFCRVHNRWKMSYYASALLDELDRQVDRCEVAVFLWQTSHVGSPTNEWSRVV